MQSHSDHPKYGEQRGREFPLTLTPDHVLRGGDYTCSVRWFDGDWWTFWKHPDGQWVTLRKALPLDLIVADTTSIAPPTEGMTMQSDLRAGPLYRKTSLIRAIQWHKMGDHPAVVPLVPNKRDPNNPNYSLPNQSPPPNISLNNQDFAPGMERTHGYIKTLEGGHIVTPGDWIATGVEGENWPIKPNTFAATYAPASTPAPCPASEGAAREIADKYVHCDCDVLLGRHATCCNIHKRAVCASAIAALIASPKPDAGKAMLVYVNGRLAAPKDHILDDTGNVRKVRVSNTYTHNAFHEISTTPGETTMVLVAAAQGKIGGGNG